MWLDLRLRGVDPEKIRTDEKSLLLGHLARQRDLRYIEVMVIVKAIVSAANAIAGTDPGSVLQDIVKDYTDLCYPERAHHLEDKVEKTKRILEREFAKGPMKVQAQEYDKKRKKKRR